MKYSVPAPERVIFAGPTVIRVVGLVELHESNEALSTLPTSCAPVGKLNTANKKIKKNQLYKIYFHAKKFKTH